MSQNATPSSNPTDSTSGLKSNSYHIDWFQFTIALVVIVSFTIFVMKVIWNNPTFDESYKIIALVAPFVGTIIGFYFGQKPIQGLTQQIAQVTSEKQTMRNDLAEAVTNSDSLEKRLERMEKRLESLNSIINGN